MTVTIIKKTKNLKTQVGIFKNMGENFPGESLIGGNFPDITGTLTDFF